MGDNVQEIFGAISGTQTYFLGHRVELSNRQNDRLFDQ